MRLFLYKSEIPPLVHFVRVPQTALSKIKKFFSWGACPVALVPCKKLAPLALGHICAFGANLDILGPASRIIFFKT